MITVRRATPDVLELILRAGHLFDGPPDALQTAAFLDDPRHHLFLAFWDDQPAGFASAVDYLHPDKPRAFWINELGVDDAYRRRGLATAPIAGLTDPAISLKCCEIWLLADPTDEALGFYTALGWTREGTHLAMFTKSLS